MRTDLTRIALTLVLITLALVWPAPAPVAAQGCDAGYTLVLATTPVTVTPTALGTYLYPAYVQVVTGVLYINSTMVAPAGRVLVAATVAIVVQDYNTLPGSVFICAQMPATATPLAATATPLAAIATPSPTATPLPTALPTLLPDQTFTALTNHTQAVAQLGTKPRGIAIVALLFLWAGLWLLTKR
jgi:hypothetical protein